MKATRKSKAKSAPQFSPITLDDPRAPAILAAASEYLGKRPSRSRRKPNPRVSFSSEKIRDFALEAGKLAMMISAVHRLSWLADDSDSAANIAAQEALEAISMLASWRADRLAYALGGSISYCGSGHAEELESLARVYAIGRDHQRESA